MNTIQKLTVVIALAIVLIIVVLRVPSETPVGEAFKVKQLQPRDFTFSGETYEEARDKAIIYAKSLDVPIEREKDRQFLIDTLESAEFKDMILSDEGEVKPLGNAGCTYDWECGLGKRCEDGYCVSGCLDNGDCPGGQSCVGGQCVPLGKECHTCGHGRLSIGSCDTVCLGGDGDPFEPEFEIKFTWFW